MIILGYAFLHCFHDLARKHPKRKVQIMTDFWICTQRNTFHLGLFHLPATLISSRTCLRHNHYFELRLCL